MRTIPGASTLALLLGPLLLPACSTDAGPGDADASELRPGVQEHFTLGSLEGGRWDSFSRIASVAFDGDGRLHVLDADEYRITVVGADGELAHQFGEQGGGPGELRLPMALAVLPSGDVVVSDGGHRGVLVFGPDGRFLRSAAFGEGTAGAGLIFPHGNDALVFASRGITITSRGGPPTMPTDIPVQRLSLEEGEGTRVLHRAWRPTREMPGAGGGAARGSGPGGMIAFGGPRAFEPQLHLAVLPDGRIAVADSTAYRIRILGSDGSEVDRIERPIAPRPVTEVDQEAERARRLTDLQEGRGPQVRVTTTDASGSSQAMGTNDLRDVLEEQVRNMEFWPEMPVIERLAADRAGRLWVRRSAGVDEPGPIEILTPDGALVGTIPAGELAFPDAFGPNGLAAWVERDELDVPYVRVGRLTGLP